MDAKGHDVSHLEVRLGGDAVLVVIRSPSGVFLRLRTFRDGAWRFVTPPLPLGPSEAKGLSSGVEEARGVPVTLAHESMGGKLNLLVYRGRVHVHFANVQISGSAADLAQALASLVG